MSEGIITQDTSIKTATSLNEATKPLRTYLVRCVVSNVADVEVLAASPQEAADAASKVQGVIWPLGLVKVRPVEAKLHNPTEAANPPTH